ncbi:MAG: hypothetical protein ABWX96_08310, partial [Propionibacteriaceae bacterium]
MPEAPKKRPADGAKPAPSRSGNPAVRASAPRTQSKPRSATPPSAPPPPRSPLAVFDDATVLPVDGVEYPQILRNSHYALWRSLAG